MASDTASAPGPTLGTSVRISLLTKRTLLQLHLQSYLLSRLSETRVAHWTASLSAAVPKKERAPQEGIRQETTQNQ